MIKLLPQMQSDLGLPCLSRQLVFEILEQLLQFIMSLKHSCTCSWETRVVALVIVCKMHFG